MHFGSFNPAMIPTAHIHNSVKIHYRGILIFVTHKHLIQECIRSVLLQKVCTTACVTKSCSVCSFTLFARFYNVIRSEETADEQMKYKGNLHKTSLNSVFTLITLPFTMCIKIRVLTNPKYL